MDQATPTHTGALPATVPNGAVPQAEPFVGELPDCDAPMSDEAREDAIRRCGKAIEHHMAQWSAYGDFAARGNADRARCLMERLIAGRSAAQVARMELERGLR